MSGYNRVRYMKIPGQTRGSILNSSSLSKSPKHWDTRTRTGKSASKTEFSDRNLNDAGTQTDKLTKKQGCEVM